MPGLDLAAIGNCAVASLVDSGGRHVWHCFPRLDGDPVFCALVDGDAPESGFMDIVMRDRVHSAQAYLANSAVLETTLEDKSGAKARIVDFAPRFKRFGRTFRPPLLVRRIEPLTGRPRVTVRLRPSFGYGAERPQVSLGSNHMRYMGAETTLRVTTDMPLTYLAREAEFSLDRPVHIFFGTDETIPEQPGALAERFLSETTSYWRDWVRDLAVPFDWQEAVIRAAITLKLCTYDDTGAVIAAMTTSLPEAPGSTRNWDYRYCWLRDAYFTVNALNRLGATRTMEGVIRFVVDSVLRSDDAQIAPLYPIAPGTPLDEYDAPALRGYGGHGPVRVGNAAATQRQNDVYGSIILTAAQMFWDQRLPLAADADLYAHLRPIAGRAYRAALETDAGIWEYRGRLRVHTFSAVMCWAALHRMGLIARKVGAAADAELWLGQARSLRTEILRRATTGDGWLSGALDAEIVDAAILLLPEIGFLSAKDALFIRTLETVEKRLLRNGFVMRYDESDDFGAPETAFLVCTFWYIDALAAAGRRDEALTLFENILTRRNHVGLFGEDIDPKTGRLWGNFPQTYSHVGLIHSAMRLSRSWEEGLWRAS